jgi:hypothetical protein
MPRELKDIFCQVLLFSQRMQGTSNAPTELAIPGAKAKGQTVLRRSTVKASPDVSPVTRTAISLEYASLRHSQHCPLGIYVIPSAETLLVWDAVFFVHQGTFGN